jgi:hypothetical protein
MILRPKQISIFAWYLCSWPLPVTTFSPTFGYYHFHSHNIIPLIFWVMFVLWAEVFLSVLPFSWANLTWARIRIALNLSRFCLSPSSHVFNDHSDDQNWFECSAKPSQVVKDPILSETGCLLRNQQRRAGAEVRWGEKRRRKFWVSWSPHWKSIGMPQFAKAIQQEYLLNLCVKSDFFVRIAEHKYFFADLFHSLCRKSYH